MTIFKANDIRGLWPNEVNEEVFGRLGRALAIITGDGLPYVVGCDARLSGEKLKRALIAGLAREGVAVTDLGQVSTPECYFAKRAWRAPNLAMVTASHNPPEYNGLKVMLGDMAPTDELLRDIRETFESLPPAKEEPVGELTARSVRDEYVAWLDNSAAALLAITRSAGRPRLVFDAGHGPVGRFGPGVFERAHADVVPLNCEVDGRFPHRDPNCAIAEHLAGAMQAVRASNAALAVAFDGDGDRLACIDDAGCFVPADELAVLLMKTGTMDVRGEKVVYDIKCSSLVPDAIREVGGTPLIEKSGHAYIRRRMLEEGARFGIEVSGHYFHRELAGGDDAMLSALRVAEMAFRAPLTELRRRHVPPRFITPDVRVHAGPELQDEIIETLARYHADREQLRLDGLRVEFVEGWALVRKSITEPKLTFRFEAAAADGLERVVRTFIHPLAETLREEILAKALKES